MSNKDLKYFDEIPVTDIYNWKVGRLKNEKNLTIELNQLFYSKSSKNPVV